MKLEKNDKYAGILLTASMLVLLSLLPKKNNNIEIENIELENTNTEINNLIKSNSLYDNNIEILNEEYRISNTYKILEFIDQNGYYKIMFAIGYVDYEETDEELITTYTICDAFSKEELFKTTKEGRKLDLENIYDINPLLKEIKILGYDSILNIEKYSEHVNEIYEDIISLIKNRDLSEYELKEMYNNLFDESVKVNLNSYKVYQR